MPSLFWGFRLTIWNVNQYIIQLLSCWSCSFRLTIWNVKQQEQQLILPFLANVLY
ncbi:hypothetical protein QCG06_002573 [Clostridioides difficile]|nr:hypothetical protein [Clostridioides difficile]MDK3373562.1 hypothetical protein [Clostridioides difficile]HBF7378628.1 hypothetical protein [Clostridioides difficile]